MTSERAPTRLFEPIEIRGVRIENRIVKSAMAEGLCDPDGRPLGAALAVLYERWAAGGVGLAITGMAHLRRGYSFTDHEIGLHDDALIEPLRAIPAAAHRHGGRVFVQLCHAPPQLPRSKAQAFGALAPSRGLSPTSLLWQRPIDDRELVQVAAEFGGAARRARLAGFDGVQLHAAHGYLLSRMLSPRHNRRQDRWGGDFDRRLRFLGEVYRAVRAEVGDDYPVTVKLNAHDGEPGGLELGAAVRIGQQLEAWGVDAIEVSAGTADVGLGLYPSRGELPLDLSERFLGREFPLLRPALRATRLLTRRIARRVALEGEAYFLAEARRFAEALSIPVICVGGVRSHEVAERILRETPVAMVSLARPLVRQPGLPAAWRAGRTAAASCTSCNRCLLHVGLGDPLRCYSGE